MKKDSQKENDHLETVTDKVGETAVHYGFTVIKTPEIKTSDSSASKQFKEFDYHEDSAEKTALTNWYIDGKHDMEAQPVAIHYKKPLLGNGLKKKTGIETYGLEIMGSSRATSEALIIKCTLAILDDLGYKDLYIDLNSIGDRESVSKFERELGTHFRKNSHLLPAKFKADFKKNHYAALSENSAEISEFKQSLPQTIGSLSEVGRLHFKEVLESIEAFEVTYKIKPSILSNKLFATHTVFEIRENPTTDGAEGELLASGYRYNHMAKKIGAKREIPSIGVTIMVKKNPKLGKKIVIKKIKKPHLYLVQLGNTAKLKALNVVEMLRKNKILVYHSITKDKITGQLNGAEYMKATHVLVMGQKEAIENSIIVRNVANREQETVLLKDLVEFLKKLEEKTDKK